MSRQDRVERCVEFDRFARGNSRQSKSDMRRGGRANRNLRPHLNASFLYSRLSLELHLNFSVSSLLLPFVS